MTERRGHYPAIRQGHRLDGARVIEKRERKCEPALPIDDHKPPVANPGDDSEVSRLELRLASQTHNLVADAWIALVPLGIIRRLRRILDPVAIVSEGIHALAVVVLKTREIHVRRLDQLLARGAFTGGNPRNEQRIWLPHRIELLRRIGIPHHKIFHFGNFSVGHLKPKAENHRVVPLFHHADETDLACLRLRKIKLERAFAVERAPRALADFQPRGVLSECHVACQGQL